MNTNREVQRYRYRYIDAGTIQRYWDVCRYIVPIRRPTRRCQFFFRWLFHLIALWSTVTRLGVWAVYPYLYIYIYIYIFQFRSTSGGGATTMTTKKIQREQRQLQLQLATPSFARV